MKLDFDKHHKIYSAAIAVGFVVVVQLFASPDPVFRFLIPALVLYTSVVQGYNYKFLKHKNSYNFWKIVLMGLFFISWFGVFTLLPNYMIRGIYLLVSMPLIYIAELLLASFSEQVLINEVLLTAFGGFVFMWGLEFYFHLPDLSVLGTELVLLFLLVRSSYEFMPHSGRLKMVSALVISLFSLQVHWALSFLPIHYSALALMSFSIFYAVWTLYYYALLNVLTPQRIKFYTLFALGSIVIIILATPWSILT